MSATAQASSQIPNNHAIDQHVGRIGHLQLLDYQQIGGSLDKITARTEITAFAAHDLFIVIGTAAGTVHVLDLAGNESHSWAEHSGAISALLVSADGEIIVAGGRDGRVVFFSLVGEQTTTAELRSPVLAVAADSNFGRAQKTVFIGLEDGHLVSLTMRALLSSKELVIHRGEGPVTALAVSGSLLAAATSFGVRIFDVNLELRVAFIDRPASTTGGAALGALVPTLRWRVGASQAAPLLLLAWGDTVLTVRVRRQNVRLGGAGQSTGGRAAEIVSRVTLGASHALIGAAPFEDELFILGGPLGRLEEEVQSQPEAEADADADAEADAEAEADAGAKVEPKAESEPEPEHDAEPSTVDTAVVLHYPTVLVVGQDGRELLYEGLDVFEDCQLTDIKLCVSPAAAEPRAELALTASGGDMLRYLFPSPKEALSLIYYLVSPHRVVAAVRANILQHVEALVARGLVEEAIHTAEADATHTLTADHIRALGRRFVLSLLERGDASRAAAACPRYLGTDAQLWQRFIFIFAQAGRLSALVPYLPTREVRLPDVAYGSVLAHFLATDHAAFEELVSRWPSNLYDALAVTEAVRQRIRRLTDAAHGAPATGLQPLYRALFTLYDGLGQRVRALHYLLLVADRSTSSEAFAYIRRHSLYAAMQDRVDDLLRLDPDAAVGLLASAPDALPPHFVISQIQASHASADAVSGGGNSALYRYLATVEQTAPGRLSADHLDTLVSLTAELAPEKLGELIARNDGIRLHNARRVCRDRGLLRPQVQILQRIGTEQSHREALEILVSGLRDVDAAVDYVIANGDSLWPLLIKLASSEASFATVSTNGRPDAAAAAQAQCAFVQALLAQTGSRIHPAHCATLLQQVPSTLELPGLRDRLGRVISQCHLQVSMRRSTNSLVRADTAQLAASVHAAQKRGCIMRAGVACALCGSALMSEKHLLGDDSREGGPLQGRVVSFRCGHAYHGVCLGAQPGKQPRCPQCDTSHAESS